jgi:hypothetical protein
MRPNGDALTLPIFMGNDFLIWHGDAGEEVHDVKIHLVIPKGPFIGPTGSAMGGIEHDLARRARGIVCQVFQETLILEGLGQHGQADRNEGVGVGKRHGFSLSVKPLSHQGEKRSTDDE